MGRFAVGSFSYSVRALLASAVLYFVLDLSQGDRGVVDYVVIGLVLCAVAWNVGQLGRRMYGAGGGKALWSVQRAVLFWVIGLLNTVWLRPEHVGGWRNYLGWVILAFAVFDTAMIVRAERRILRQASEGREASAVN